MGSVTTQHVKLYHNLTNGVKLKYEKNVNMAQFSAFLDYDNRFPHFCQVFYEMTRTIQFSRYVYLSVVRDRQIPNK